MKRIVLAAGLAILMMPNAHADDCMDKATAQVEMDACAVKAFKASDAELNKLYRQIEHRLSDSDAARKQLVAAQRAWVAFRDAECAFASSAVEGGSVYPMISTMCLDDLTRKRIADFNQYLHCQEGDLSCPVPGN